MNIYKFPYDKQTYSIQIGSWGLVNEIISFYHKEFVEKNAVDFVPNSLVTFFMPFVSKASLSILKFKLF